MEMDGLGDCDLEKRSHDLNFLDCGSSLNSFSYFRRGWRGQSWRCTEEGTQRDMEVSYSAEEAQTEQEQSGISAYQPEFCDVCAPQLAIAPTDRAKGRMPEDDGRNPRRREDR